MSRRRLTIEEAAKELRLSVPTLYRRIQAGLLKTVKDGARSFVMSDELERYLTACDAVQK